MRNLGRILGALALFTACGESQTEPNPIGSTDTMASMTQLATSSGAPTSASTAAQSSTSAATSAPAPATSSAPLATTSAPASESTTTAVTVPAASSTTSALSSTSASSSEPGSETLGSEVSSVDSTSEAEEDLVQYAVGFHELYIHDECTDDNPADDVCAHDKVHEVPFTFGGDPTTNYDVTLRIRGLFEPTNVAGGMSPYPEHPYFQVGGTVTKTDYSQWQIRVAEPEAIYYLNHYPTTGHTIYKEDFEATLRVRGGASVVVRVEDANDRQIDNGYVGLPDRQQTLEGVTDGVVNGQVLRLDVLGVAVAP